MYSNQTADADAIASGGQDAAKSAGTDLLGYPMCSIFVDLLSCTTALDYFVKAVDHIQGDIGRVAHITSHRGGSHIIQQISNRFSDHFRFIASAQANFIRNNIFFQNLHQAFQFGLHRLHADEAHRGMRGRSHVDALRFIRPIQIETEPTVAAQLCVYVDGRTTMCHDALGQMHI